MKILKTTKIIIMTMILSCIGLFGFASRSHAAVLFDQPLDSSLLGIYSNENLQVYSDNFILSSNAIVTDVHWYGYYAADFVPTTSTMNFQINIYDDSLTFPDTLLYSQMVSAVLTDTGLITPDNDYTIYEFTVDPASPFFVTGGENYWLSILDSDASTTGAQGWLWSRSNLDSGANSSIGNFPSHGTGDLAFSLTGRSVVPEPASMMLLGSGLVGFGFIRRRKA